MNKVVLDMLFRKLYYNRLKFGSAELADVEKDLYNQGVAAWKLVGVGYAFRLKNETTTHFWYLGKGIV